MVRANALTDGYFENYTTETLFNNSQLFLLDSIDFITNAFSLFGILLNGLTLLLCWANVREHSYVWFIGNLASAHLLTSINYQILLGNRLLVDHHENACLASAFLSVFSVGSAIGSQPLLAFNRYIAIKHQTWYKPLFGKRWTICSILILAGWVPPFIFACIDYSNNCLIRKDKSFLCILNAGSTRPVCAWTKIIHFILCYSILCYCYTKIYVTLKTHQMMLTESATIQQGGSNLANDKQLLHLMALHALAPLIIQSPALILVLSYSEDTPRNSRIAQRVAVALFMMEPALDAILTMVIVKLFRTTLMEYVDWIKTLCHTNCWPCRTYQSSVVKMESGTSLSIRTLTPPNVVITTP